MRKPRSPQGPLNKLTEAQRARLDRMLFEENLPYAKAAEILKAEFGISTSGSALGAYFKRMGRRRLEQSIATAAEESTVRASGVEVTITCQRPGEIRLAIRPLA